MSGNHSDLKNRGYQVSVNAGSTTNYTFDLDGNMTSDGTNSYAWDAANRLIKITYPGTNNFSTFAYDGFGRNVEIVETVSGSVTSTKQFVWSDGDKPCEARNSSGTVTAQYFPYGETISGSSYYWTRDHLGSIREMSNFSGTVQSQYSYDSFGRSTLLQGSVASDFQFAAYYQHSPSGLNLARRRAYQSGLGRWLSRDKLGSSNLYLYAANMPSILVDPSGLTPRGGTSTAPPEAPPIIETPPTAPPPPAAPPVTSMPDWPAIGQGAGVLVAGGFAIGGLRQFLYKVVFYGRCLKKAEDKYDDCVKDKIKRCQKDRQLKVMRELEECFYEYVFDVNECRERAGYPPLNLRFDSDPGND